MPFAIGGNQLDTGYEVSNSLRLTDNAYLNITRSSQSNTTGTFSAWIKPSLSDSVILAGAHTDVNNRSYFYFPSPGGGFSGGLFSRTSGSLDINFNTNAVYRDPSAWYHLVVAFDTTQATESNRFKMYVNGEQVTSFSASTYPSQNASLPIFNKAAQTVGANYGASSISGWSHGYIAEYYYIDGTQYAASDFGETNDNGVWIPKDASGDLTFGTNGFYLEFKQTGTSQNSSGIGADTSGNDNHLAVNSISATDVTTDTPTNNFATLNPLDQSNSYAQNDATSGTFSEGNCNFSSAGQIGGFERYYNTTATIAIPSSGKWYWEAKPNNGTNGLGFRWVMGLLASNHGYSNANFTEWTEAQGQRGAYKADGTVWYNNNQISSGHGTPSVNDIISFKYDADNRDFFVAVNGTYINSGNAVLTSSNITATDFLLIFLQNGSDGNVATAMNFGNAPFSISSGNSDANGYGNFEYAVPSGYFALCTKNLAEYG